MCFPERVRCTNGGAGNHGHHREPGLGRLSLSISLPSISTCLALTPITPNKKAQSGCLAPSPDTHTMLLQGAATPTSAQDPIRWHINRQGYKEKRLGNADASEQAVTPRTEVLLS